MKFVVGFLFDREMEKVVLIRKTHPEWQEGLLNGVGGKIEGGEDPIDAMIREFEEEAGKYYEDWHEFSHLRYESGENIWFFVGMDDQDVESKTEEKIEIRDQKNISNLETVPNLNWLIPMAKTSLNQECNFKIYKKQG